MGMNRDITEHKQAGARLQESVEHFRVLAEYSLDTIMRFDRAHRHLYVNPIAEQQTGIPVEEFIGKTHAELGFPDDLVTLWEQAIDTVFESGEPYRIEFELPQHIWIDWMLIPEFSADGNVRTVSTSARDITEHKRAEEERLKLKKLESVGLLAGGIAHDFNNLLIGLFGNIELAKMFLSADHKSYKLLESAGQAMESATNLTKQLLTFAKGGDPIKEALSIGEVIIEMAEFSLRGGIAKLQSNIAPDLWLVEADKGQLSQVISNLVINAQQAMPAGGTIIIAAKNVETSEGRYVKFTVQDEGVGIAAQYLDKIFDPYFSTKQKGSGLGLASTHSIISKHNGTITVDSQLNKGTIFTIHLPATEEKEETVAGEFPVKTLVTAVSSARILVMDDEEMVREVTGAMLERLGYEVIFAVDGQEATAKYRTSYENHVSYDAVITDLTIPGGMGGKEAAQEILKINSQAKIIVSSGYATDPVMANYEEYGFQARVVKPYHFAYLQEVLQQVLKT